jgi:Fe2+ transport system protein FeoA
MIIIIIRRSHSMTLAELKKNKEATITDYNRGQHEINVIPRLIEMGLVKGAKIKIIHSAPINRDPIAVEVKGAIIALGKNEADQIIVEEV